MTPDALPRRDGIEEVVARIEEDVIFGRLAPGARLTEDTLMARFGASRHFIRQALVEVERRGIVRREKNVGATVRSYSAEEVRQIYDVREMLTRQAALMIDLPAPASLLDELRACQARYRAFADGGDLREAHDANDAFHLTLFGACGNPYLVRTLADYMGLTLPMRAKNLADRAGLALSLSQHELMIRLMGGRDRWAFAELCVEHMAASKADYLGRIEGCDREVEGAGAGSPIRPRRPFPSPLRGGPSGREASDRGGGRAEGTADAPFGSTPTSARPAGDSILPATGRTGARSPSEL